jgi:hypothetical protein
MLAFRAWAPGTGLNSLHTDPFIAPMDIRKALKGGVYSGTIVLDMDGTRITVANSVNPTYLVAAEAAVTWLVRELHKDVVALAEGSLPDVRSEETCCVAPDSDDDDPEAAAALQEIEEIKKGEARHTMHSTKTITCAPT